MKQKAILKAIMALFLFFGLIWDVSAQRTITSTSQSETMQTRVEKIAVMPFFKGRFGDDVNETLDTPLSRFFFNPENIDFDGDKILMELTHRALRKIHEGKVLPQGDVETTWKAMSIDRTKDSPRLLSQKVGHTLAANVVMIGSVWRYRDRVGGDFGIERPAAVAFELYLINVATGRLLWNGSFNETQQSLNRNVLDAGTFFKRGGKWLTARQLATFGLDETLKKYPY